MRSHVFMLLVLLLLTGCTSTTASSNGADFPSESSSMAHLLLRPEDLASFGDVALLLTSGSDAGTSAFSGWNDAATAVFSVQMASPPATLTLTNMVYRFPSIDAAHAASVAFSPSVVGVTLPLKAETQWLNAVSVQQLQARGAMWRVWSGADDAGVVHTVAVVHFETDVFVLYMTSFATAGSKGHVADTAQASAVATQMLNHVVARWLATMENGHSRAS